jgi:predicted NBD/HSP70 family sugar kinase
MRSSHPVVAVDLGGTKIRAAVVSPDNNVVVRTHCLTCADKGPNEVIQRLND